MSFYNYTYLTFVDVMLMLCWKSYSVDISLYLYILQQVCSLRRLQDSEKGKPRPALYAGEFGLIAEDRNDINADRRFVNMKSS